MEANVEQKLKALYELQTIHSSIDKIRTVRGELPMEVADLEDDVAGLETRIHKIKDEIGTNNYYAFDPSKPNSQAVGSGNARAASEQSSSDDQNGDAQWYKESVMGESSTGEPVAMYSSVFEIIAFLQRPLL